MVFWKYGSEMLCCLPTALNDEVYLFSNQDTTEQILQAMIAKGSDVIKLRQVVGLPRGDELQVLPRAQAP
jgi:hypothetical protein